MKVIVRPARREEFERCVALRRAVFQDEQGIPWSAELDAFEAECVHLLALLDEEALGTARFRLETPAVARAERVAVLKKARGLGVGRALMTAVEALALEAGASQVLVSAQMSALPFYEALGYRPEGAIYQEVAIPHRKARKFLA